MKSTTRLFSLFPGLVLLAAGCQTETALAPQGMPPALFTGGGGCSPLYLSSGILEPINADNSSSFQLGRTLPVKIRIWDCATLDGVNTLAPMLSLTRIDLGGGEVNEIVSSSAADEGTTMRSAGNGQYIFNLSTKRSQFNAGEDLVPGIYELTISMGDPSLFTPVVVLFTLRR